MTSLPEWLDEIQDALVQSARLLGATEPTSMQRLLELALAQHEALELYERIVQGSSVRVAAAEALGRARKLWGGSCAVPCRIERPHWRCE